MKIMQVIYIEYLGGRRRFKDHIMMNMIVNFGCEKTVMEILWVNFT